MFILDFISAIILGIGWVLKRLFVLSLFLLQIAFVFAIMLVPIVVVVAIVKYLIGS